MELMVVPYWWLFGTYEGCWVHIRVAEWIWGSLSGYEGRWVDMRVAEWIWRSLSEYQDRCVDMRVAKWIWGSLCGYDGHWVDMRVAEWMWGSLSWYACHQVNIDLSEWIGEDGKCYIPTSTRCALTHTWWDNHFIINCHCDASVQGNPFEKAQQIEVRGVGKSKMLGSQWDGSE